MSNRKLVTIIITVIVGLIVFYGGMGYVAHHFIAKYW